MANRAKEVNHEGANMNLRTVADVMWALNCSLGVSARPLDFWKLMGISKGGIKE